MFSLPFATQIAQLRYRSGLKGNILLLGLISGFELNPSS
jgi:hypothetical protein